MYPETVAVTDPLPPFVLDDFVLDTGSRRFLNNNNGWCSEGVDNNFYNYRTSDDGQGGSTIAQKFWLFCHFDNRNWQNRRGEDPIAIFTEAVVWTGDLRLIVSNQPDIDLISLSRGHYGFALATLILTGDDDEDPCDQSGSARFWSGSIPSYFQVFKDNFWEFSMPAPSTVTSAEWTMNIVVSIGDIPEAQGVPVIVRRVLPTRLNNDIYLCLNAYTSQTQTNWLNEFNVDDRISILPATSGDDPADTFDNLAIRYQQRTGQSYDAFEDLTSAERLGRCPNNFVSEVSEGGTWSFIGRFFTDPLDNFSRLARATVSGIGCVLQNLFIPSEAELGDIMSESESCSDRVSENFGDKYEEYLVEQAPACKVNDLWGVVYSDIEQASRGAWPRCKQPFVDMTGFSDLELNKNVLDTNEDGTIQDSEGEDFDTIQGAFVVDACTTNGEESLLKSSSGIIRPIASVGLLLFLLFALAKMIQYALVLSDKGSKI